MSTLRALVVVAHPDDETFGTGSVIAALASAGAEVVVCCATRGEAGEAANLPDGADLGAVREAELRAAGAVLGVSRFELLGYRDSGMHGEAPPGSLVAAAYDEVVAAVRTVVDDVDPAVVVTLDPDHGDGHRDHERIGRATVEACAGRPGTRVYLWVVARELMRAWFTELARVRPDAGHLALDLDAAGIGRPDADVTTLLDVSAYRVLREQAMAEHRSQQPPLDGMPAELHDEFLGHDRLVRVQPPWQGGDLERSLI